VCEILSCIYGCYLIIKLASMCDTSILYRGPSIAATYQVSVHFAKRFQRRRFFMNRPISNTNCLCWPCLLTDPKWAIFIEGLGGSIYGRPSIKIAHLGSVNKHGQHRQFVLLIGRFPKNLLLRNRLAKWTETWFHSCYLSSFGSFCQAVSEKIFYESTNQQHELPVLAMFVNRSCWFVDS
jgi:hypothetical protein